MKKHIFLFLLGMLASMHVHAVLDIRITQGIEEALPIAIIPFDWQGTAEQQPIDMHVTIANNLSRSGRFRTMNPEDMPQRPSEFNQINFMDWRLLGMENIVIGNIQPKPDGNYDIEFRLVNIYSGTQIAGFRVSARRDQLRRTAHRISDIVFERLTSIRGAFDTRIAYVTMKTLEDNSRQYTLQISDADGFNPTVLLESDEPLMSPAWSHDGERLAYVSFEGRNSSVFVQHIRTGQRERVAAHQGINSAPAWSPDDSRLALTLSKDGNPEIYIMHLSSGNLVRVTNNRGIDTEPAWSPDGRSLIFTSDRGGSPQIYKIDALGGNAERLTFTGNYNARARYSPDGRSITMVHGAQGQYRIAVMDMEQRHVNILTNARFDESPSFAPNGSMIIYATSQARGSELAAVSADGRVHQRLALQEGEVREPAWGPFPSQ